MMDNFTIGLLSFPVLLILIFIRIPIGVSMLITGFIGNWLIIGSPNMMLSQMKSLPIGTFSSYSLSIIPLFLLMGQFATVSGMSSSLFKAAEVWIGHKRGGVAMAAIGACAGFGAICGSSMATAVTMGKVAMPELKKYGYSGSLASGTLAAGGTLGVLIPPSVILVIYAILAEQNIAKLFVAAFIPGILAAGGYIIAIAIYVRLYPETAGSSDRKPYRERLKILSEISPVLAIFILVVGGIYLGFFTPTEAAAVGAAGTGLIALFTKKLTASNFFESLRSTAGSTAMIFIIILGATVFNNFLALAQVPQNAAEFIGGMGFSPWLIMIAVLLMYLIFGCVMDSLSMILLTVPIFYPIMSNLDFGIPPDEFGLWFGILILVVVEVGLITPPVGMNLFVIKSMDSEISIKETFRGVFPFIISDLVRIVFLTVFPSITLGMVWLLY